MFEPVSITREIIGSGASLLLQGDGTGALPPEVAAFEGKVEGSISLSPRGTTGFGYDPLFVPDGYSSTFAEIAPSEKNAISHRARALAQFVEYLESFE